MSAPKHLEKALMTTMTFAEQGKPAKEKSGPRITVQFNPESLKLSYANSMQGGDQSGGAAMQFVGQSTTKLSFDLWFDVSAPMPPRKDANGDDEKSVVKDVRKLTKYVVGFMKPVEVPDPKNPKETKRAPPGVRFLWGAFRFDGIVESVNETIDFFSSEGHALRSQLSVSMSQQEIPADMLKGSEPGGGLPVPGIDLQAPIAVGDTLQSLAGDLGLGEDWQSLAALNDIEDPRNLDPGAMLTLSG